MATMALGGYTVAVTMPGGRLVGMTIPQGSPDSVATPKAAGMVQQEGGGMIGSASMEG